MVGIQQFRRYSMTRGSKHIRLEQLSVLHTFSYKSHRKQCALTDKRVLLSHCRYVDLKIQYIKCPFSFPHVCLCMQVEEKTHGNLSV